MAMLQFPLDNAQDYNGWVTFRFIKVDLAVNATGLGGVLDSFTSYLNDDEDASVAGADLVDGEETQTEEPGLSISANETTQITGGVRLYLPQSLNFADGMVYDNNVDLGVVGGAALAGLQAGASVSASQVADMAMSSFRSVGDFLANGGTGDAARIAAMRLAHAGGETTRNVISAGLRIAPNPNKRTLFRSVRPREFTFNFKMIANSAGEARAMREIIRQFRMHMYPEPTVAAGGADLIAYNYPDLVEVNLAYNGQRVGNRIRRGYVTNLQTVYNPSSMGYHVDGMPSEIDIGITIYEDRPLDRRDIEQGY